jgi:hypothetical protein
MKRELSELPLKYLSLPDIGVNLLCDYCKTPINRLKDGCLEWISEGSGVKGVRVVHRFEASPFKNFNPDGCYHYDKAPLGHYDWALHHLVGTSDRLIAFLYLIHQVREGMVWNEFLNTQNRYVVGYGDHF